MRDMTDGDSRLGRERERERGDEVAVMLVVVVMMMVMMMMMNSTRQPDCDSDMQGESCLCPIRDSRLRV